MTETAVDPLEQFARGDAEAFEALFRQSQGEAYGRVVRIVRDPAAAEDLTVETFWWIWRLRPARIGFIQAGLNKSWAASQSQRMVL